MSKHRSAVPGDLIQVFDDDDGDRTSTRCGLRLFYEVPASDSVREKFSKTIATHDDGDTFLDYSRLAKIFPRSDKFVAAGGDT